ncbi:NmrA family NAD(P)-binding protein [Yinghuangia soli]|uniref:NmrA family NAD(P)-binding protein n=1 Tax=Yinghuangia soli TaxID=2908204 RepID=A0AA41Q157_9ACTN|nr:NmrA family NAD(P)-binding protein [Yinghuangia soli]MCF2528876.1 NmrA family NAD(P)-binding protein [Yinghuangia soli]
MTPAKTTTPDAVRSADRPPHRHLVFGASGAQGGAVVRHLLSQGAEIRGFGRKARRGADFGLGAGAASYTHVSGDLEDAVAVKAAFAGVTHASVVLPMVYVPSQVARYVRNIIDGAAAAGVERLVFNTANRVPGTSTGIGAFETRRSAAEALLASPVPTVVLRPPLYLENLCAPWVAAQIVGGGGSRPSGVLRYPLPADVPVAWLGHGDLAAATVAALTRDGLAGRTIDLGGPDTVTGRELAAALGAELGHEVAYEAQDPSEFEAALAPVLGDAAAAEVAATYRWAARDAGLFAADAGALRESLGVRLTPLRSWIAAQPWHALAAGASR